MIKLWRRNNERTLNIRSDIDFDPSDKLSLGYLSITVTNQKETKKK